MLANYITITYHIVQKKLNKHCYGNIDKITIGEWGTRRDSDQERARERKRRCE